jgi:beta-mannosidase
MTPVCERVLLTHGWSAAGISAGSANGPQALDRRITAWEPAHVPGTVAETFRGLKADDIDGQDWWYRIAFALDPIADGERLTLCLDGLATLTDVWLNGIHVLESRSMFRAHRVNIRELARTENELVLRFSSLHALLAQRRPRPRWRTRLVENQRLRFVRTSLLGRMPGWSARNPAVGPWRPVAIERWRPPRVRGRRIATVVSETSARVDVAITLDVDATAAPATLEGAIALCGVHAVCNWAASDPGTLVGTATIEVPQPERWWPHTHGAQPLHALSATLMTSGSTKRGTFDLGRVGLRSLAVDRTNDGFALRVNDEDVFCRGACWVPLHPISLRATEPEYRAALEAARDAGMNMLRIPGPTVYEDDVFFELCDELGILVWQDFMFASLDYPVDNVELRAAVEAESRQELMRWQGRPSLAVLCGGSELEQQPAMLGAPRELWTHQPIAELLARPSAELLGEVPFWPSTPHGGTFPFSVDAGTAHYYGVGAYMHGLGDLRRSSVRFATECLAIAQLPEDPPAEAGRTPAVIVGDAAWKAAVPRDVGAGWDFNDIRDHYLAQLYGIDPLRCRYEDPQRYIGLSRTVPGELLTAAFSEWRRPQSTCRGALVWLLQDLEPGAGWGIRDAWGRPKAAYFYLRRVLMPVTVVLTDEGLNGLDAHIFNERDEPLEARLALALHEFDGEHVRGASRRLVIAARGRTTLRLDALLPGFADLTHAYRFGPAGYDVAVASLSGADESVISQAWHFPGPRLAPLRPEVGLSGRCERVSPSDAIIQLETRDFAQTVTLTSEEFDPEDSYFHMAPASRRRITLRAREPDRPGTVVVRSLNSRATLRIRVE